ncbi:MAG: hypothetical protein DI586_01405 [Micavibrio aeruginosavorus]|uniref:Uncharacterized protein n=1 Tax=Micavibrio aeruginosavorus TaxID=349221 RepID=A0A2W5FTK7_9BACT|nr:MAG: hypothetical protein DI586_01405 [Micavibrio aeruginosavorus]
MLFAIAFILFAIHVALIVKARKMKWVGWLLFAIWFASIVLFGDILKAVFDMEEGSRTFFTFLAVIYTIIPLAMAEGTGKLINRKST